MWRRRRDPGGTPDPFAEVRDLRPQPAPPSVQVVRQARADLDRVIEAERIEAERRSMIDAPVQARPHRHGAWSTMSGRARFVMAAAVVAVLAGGLVAVRLDGWSLTHRQPTEAAGEAVTELLPTSGTASTVLLAAARISGPTARSATGSATTSATIRHIRFQNFTDPGAPTYDQYIYPDGHALVGEPGGRLSPTDGFIRSAELSALPTDPAALRTALLDLGRRDGLAMPDDSAERIIYRAATELLPDPGLPAQVRASVYRVVAQFDGTDVSARTGGEATVLGRTGVAIWFTFAEDAQDTWVLDRRTGALLSTETVLADGSRLGGQRYVESDLVTQVPGVATSAPGDRA